VDFEPILKQTGAVGSAITIAWLFITEQVVSGKRYRRDLHRAIENGQKWEQRYFSLIEVARRQKEAIDEGLKTVTELAERGPAT
jgi:hypothetical protein